MTKNILFEVIKRLSRISSQSKTRIALMGGIAVSVFARPRATFDIDGIVSVKEENLKDFLNILKDNGFKFERNKPIRSIQGMPFISCYYSSYKTYVDLFIARGPFQEEIIKRSRRIKLEDINLHIVSPEDLILIKLQAGRDKDLSDVREILVENKGKLDFKYLTRWAGQLKIEVFLKDELKSLGIRT